MKRILFVFAFLALVISAFAQAPQRMSYQAVIRDGNGNLVSNQQISVRLSIMKDGGNSGSLTPSTRSITAVYVETHRVTTNANGLATMEFGGDTTSDTFESIDRSNGKEYLQH